MRKLTGVQFRGRLMLGVDMCGRISCCPSQAHENRREQEYESKDFHSYGPFAIQTRQRLFQYELGPPYDETKTCGLTHLA